MPKYLQTNKILDVKFLRFGNTKTMGVTISTAKDFFARIQWSFSVGSDKADKNNMFKATAYTKKINDEKKPSKDR